MKRPPKIVLEARPAAVQFRLPDKAVALWRKELKAPAVEGVTVSILSPIYDDPDFGFSAKDMQRELKAAGKKPITLNINSPGGDAFEGVTIYNLLVDHPAPITVNILGEAASAASVIAMAGDTIRMYAGSLMMIHKSSGLAIGNAQDMRDLAGILDRLDSSVADVYASRTGMSVDDVLKLMAAETWMTPDEAVEYGFANEVVKQETKKPATVKQ
jgi:ATP-dependent Clp protease protease subunit